MGKKRSLIDGEDDGPPKKLKHSDHRLPSRSADRMNVSEKSAKKHAKKSSHKQKSKQKKKKRRKHYRDSSSSDETTSSDSTSPSSSSSTDSEKKKKRRMKKKKRRHKKSKLGEISVHKIDKSSDSVADQYIGPLPPEDLNKTARSMAPMTKEEWEKRQSVVRRVYDEETGRHRLIKGDGEILEEIVSRDRHKEINRLATKGDGAFFESSILKKVNSNNAS